MQPNNQPAAAATIFSVITVELASGRSHTHTHAKLSGQAIPGEGLLLEIEEGERAFTYPMHAVERVVCEKSRVVGVVS